MALSERVIQQAKPKERPYELTDEGDWGGGSLRLRVYPTGRKVFFGSLYYQGKRTNTKLGRYPEMTLAQARITLAQWAEGIKNPESSPPLPIPVPNDSDSLGPVSPSTLSLDEAFQKYLELHARPNKRSAKEDERRYTLHVKGALGHLELEAVRKEQLFPLLDDQIAQGHPVEANRIHALLSVFFRFAESRAWVSENPLRGVKKLARETPKERSLTWEEICLFWQATDSGNVIHRLLRAILQLAQRPGEVRQMRWDQLENGWWNLPGTLTKNKRPHRIPLLPEILLPEREEGNPWVFPGNTSRSRKRTETTNVPKPVDTSTPAHAMQQIAKAFTEGATAHDLRRTAITRMAEMGVPDAVLAAIANHTVPGITHRVYNRYAYDKEKKEALEAWNAELAERVGSIPSHLAGESRKPKG